VTLLEETVQETNEGLKDVAKRAVQTVVASKLGKAGLLAIIPVLLFKSWFTKTATPREFRAEKDVDTFVHIEPVLWNVHVQWPSAWGIPVGVKRRYLAKRMTNSGEVYVYQFATREISDIKRRMRFIKIMTDFINTQSAEREQYK
jgi:hypothetical protein